MSPPWTGIIPPLQGVPHLCRRWPAPANPFDSFAGAIGRAAGLWPKKCSHYCKPQAGKAGKSREWRLQMAKKALKKGKKLSGAKTLKKAIVERAVRE